MTSKRIYYLLIGALALSFIGIIAGTYGISTLFTTKSNDLSNNKAKSAAFAQEKVIFAKAQQQVKEYASLNEIAKAIVPQDKDQAEAVREIVNIASQYGISLASVNFPASSLGNVANPTAPTSANAPTVATKSFSQLQPVKNIPGVYQLTITVTGDSNKPVPYAKFISFLQALERNRRTAQVSTITLEPNVDNRNLLTFTLTLNEYIKP